MRSLVVLGWVIGLACYAPDPPRGAPCSSTEACPSPLVCIEGRCDRAGVRDAEIEAPIDDAIATDDAPIDAPGDAAIDAPDASQCPATYVAAAGQVSMYRLVATPTQWLAAQTDCADDGVGTHLAVIGSLAENTAVDAMSAASIKWIGQSDRVVEATWRKVTGQMLVYTNWGAGNPNGGDPQDCGVLYTGLWGDGDCTFQFPYICECDGVPSDLTAY